MPDYLKKNETVITIFEILEIRNKFRIPKMYARQATNIDIETLQPPSSQMVEGSLEVEEDAQVGRDVVICFEKDIYYSEFS